MDDARPSAEQCRDTAKGIRDMARRATSNEIRNELLQLAERYDRLAQRAQKRFKFPR